MTIEEKSTQVAEIFEKDINKLCEDINAVIGVHNKLVDENAKLKNTIKEVREYLNKNEIESVYLDCKLYETKAYKDILEILDKEVN